jgi:hypothetical protein
MDLVFADTNLSVPLRLAVSLCHPASRGSVLMHAVTRSVIQPHRCCPFRRSTPLRLCRRYTAVSRSQRLTTECSPDCLFTCGTDAGAVARDPAVRFPCDGRVARAAGASAQRAPVGPFARDGCHDTGLLATGLQGAQSAGRSERCHFNRVEDGGASVRCVVGSGRDAAAVRPAHPQRRGWYFECQVWGTHRRARLERQCC